MRMNTRRRFDEAGLQYELSSTPSPLQASPGDPTKPLAKAELIVIASNQKDAPANVASVSISFDIAPSGKPDDATYLTSIGTGIHFEVMGDPGQAVWTVTNDGAGTFTATAKAGSVPIASQGLAFLISNIQPNRSVGTFDLTITETLLDGAANAVTLQDSKFPLEFKLDNFRADSAQVGQGLATKLRWDHGVGATLKIFHAGTPEDVTGTNCWPTGNLTQDTEFVLQASVDKVALATWSLTVQVGKQILELTSLTVDQGSTLKGGATVGTAAANANLTVNGAASVTAGMTVIGNVALPATPPYAAALDVQRGWTRIGSFNTPTIPPSSTGGGMVVGWNWSGAAAETNLYNVFPNAPNSFLFSQVTSAGKTDLLSISGAGDLTVTGAIKIGSWSIGVDSSGNLVCTNSGATGRLLVGGNQVVTDGNVIYLNNGYGFLNGTTQQGGPGSGWNAGAYWQGANPPDGDSNLNIMIVS